jgi:hypothetical protein
VRFPDDCLALAIVGEHLAVLLRCDTLHSASPAASLATTFEAKVRRSRARDRGAHWVTATRRPPGERSHRLVQPMSRSHSAISSRSNRGLRRPPGPPDVNDDVRPGVVGDGNGLCYGEGAVSQHSDYAHRLLPLEPSGEASRATSRIVLCVHHRPRASVVSTGRRRHGPFRDGAARSGCSPRTQLRVGRPACMPAAVDRPRGRADRRPAEMRSNAVFGPKSCIIAV